MARQQRIVAAMGVVLGTMNPCQQCTHFRYSVVLDDQLLLLHSLIFCLFVALFFLWWLLGCVVAVNLVFPLVIVLVLFTAAGFAVVVVLVWR